LSWGKPLFYWIYDVPSLLAIAAFGVAFVAIFWLGILRPVIIPWLHSEPGLNSTLGDYLQYFGVIYGSDVLPSERIRITPTLRGRS